MSGPAKVYGTKIFSRVNRRGENVLLYEMGVESQQELAMVLPIPRREGGRFKFVDFSDYTRLFAYLEKLFEFTGVLGPGDGHTAAGVSLPVERVGSFDASFVPTLADFDRVDARFRLKPGIWEQLPAYTGWSFAVFQLRKGRHTIHPMGIAWETRFPGKCFFPTVHVHDGALHAQADFDHVLYTQGIAEVDTTWRRASEMPDEAIAESSHGFVRAAPLFRRAITGRRKNADVWAPVGA